MKTLTRFPFKYATLLLCAVLFCYQLHHAFYAPIWTDDAFFGAVAKNIAEGNGYKAVLYDKSYAFHFGITAGPLLILPASVLIMIFGNQHWVLGVTQLLLIWTLVGLIALTARRIFNGEKLWQFYFIALWLALLMTGGDAENFSMESTDRFALWFLMLGEIPAALLMVLGILVLFTNELTFRRVTSGGLIIGLAVTTKLIIAIGAAMCGIMLVVKALRTCSNRITQIRLIIICALAICTPSALFELSKIMLMGLQPYLDMQSENMQYIKYAAVIISQRENHNVTIKYDIFLQIVSLMNLIGVFATIILVPLLVYLGKVFYTAFREPAENDRSALLYVGATLILCFALHLIWWLRFTQPGYERYIITALIYLSAGLSCVLIYVQGKNSKQILIWLFLAAVMLEGCVNIKFLFYEGFMPNDKLATQLHLATLLQQREQKHQALFSCNAEYRMEYLMRGTRHMRDCDELADYNFKQPAAIYMYSVEPGKTYRQAAHGRYFMLKEPYPSAVLAYCQHEIFASGKEALRECSKPESSH